MIVRTAMRCQGINDHIGVVHVVRQRKQGNPDSRRGVPLFAKRGPL
jgi:hypothetical protein